jgi:hypothetical protein
LIAVIGGGVAGWFLGATLKKKFIVIGIIAVVVLLAGQRIIGNITAKFTGSETSTTTPETISFQDIISSNAGWVSNVDGGNASVKNNTKASINFSKETMQNQEVDVMTLTVNLASGTEWRIGEFTLDNNSFVQKLKTVNGISFSVLGDGENGWRVMFPMRETLADNCFHEATFSTTSGRITQVNIPFSKLKQPSWGKSVTFNRNNIVSIIIQRNSTESNLSGSSTIKVFDFK